MREIPEIKADIAFVRGVGSKSIPDLPEYRYPNLANELRLALTAGIPLDRLEQICEAEKGGTIRNWDSLTPDEHIGLLGRHIGWLDGYVKGKLDVIDAAEAAKEAHGDA